MRVFLGILKALALSILSLLLCLSLSVFGVALTINRTALNADFLDTEINRIDSVAMARELLNQEDAEELPPEVKEAILEVTGRLEPIVKEVATTVIDQVYRYMLGQDNDIDLAATLQASLNNPDFITSALKDLDLPALLADVDEVALFKQLVGEDEFNEMPEDTAYAISYLSDVIADLEPWLEEQLPELVTPTVDYLLGQSEGFRVEIPLDTVKATILNSFKEAFLASPPPALASLPSGALEAYFNEHYATMSDDLPATLTFDQTMFDTDPRPDIATALSEAEDGLSQARTYIGYFQLGFWLLIVLIALLITFIWLIYHRVKPASMHVGIIFAVLAVPSLVGMVVGKGFIRTQILNQPDLPAPIQSALQRLISDATMPFMVFAIALLVVAVALIVFSILYKRGAELQDA